MHSLGETYVNFDDVVFTPKPVQDPIPIWVGGESGPALRRTVKYAHGWYPVGTNPQFPMNTASRFKAGLARLRGAAEKAGRDPSEIAVALRVLTGPGTRPRRSIEGEPEMFTGSNGTGWPTSRNSAGWGSPPWMFAYSATDPTRASMPQSTTCAVSGTGF